VNDPRVNDLPIEAAVLRADGIARFAAAASRVRRVDRRIPPHSPPEKAPTKPSDQVRGAGAADPPAHLASTCTARASVS